MQPGWTELNRQADDAEQQPVTSNRARQVINRVGREVQVPAEEVKRALELVRDNTVLASCITKKATAITSGGLSHRVMRLAEQLEMPDEHKRVVTDDWGGEFEKQLYFYKETLGFAVLRPYPHPTLQNESIMHLVPWTSYTLKFTSGSNEPRTYWPEYNDVDYPAAGIEGQPLVTVNGQPIQQNENVVGYENWSGGRDSLVFIFYPPDEEGHLRSPVWRLREQIKVLRSMMSNEEYESYWARHPLHAFETVRDAAKALDRDARLAMGVGVFANGDLSNDKTRFQFRQNQDSIDDLVRASEAARTMRDMSQQSREEADKKRDAPVAAKPNPSASGVEQVSPSEHVMPVPVNQHLVAGPQVGAYGNLPHTWDRIVNEIYSTMEIPPLIADPGGAKVQGEAAIAWGEWDAHIIGEQKLLNAAYQRMFAVAYCARGRAQINAFYQAWKETSKAQSEGATVSALEPTLKKLRTLKRDDLVRQLTELEASETQAAERAKRRGVKRLVQSNLSVTFFHNYTSHVPLEELRLALEADAVEEDWYVEQVAQRVHCPPGQTLSKVADRDKQRKMRLKRKVEEQQALQPPDAEGPSAAKKSPTPKKPSIEADKKGAKV